MSRFMRDQPRGLNLTLTPGTTNWIQNCLQHTDYKRKFRDSTKPENGLLARWTFDEGEGNIAYDISGNGYHADLNNTH